MVAGEILVLPLVSAKSAVAIVFSLANAALLAWRIRQEETGLLPRAPGRSHATAAFALWLGFLAMCLGLFMAILDIQVVASALTTIGGGAAYRAGAGWAGSRPAI